LFQALTNIAAALSNQDLYELVQDAHNGALLFSMLQQAVKPLSRLLEADYDSVIEGYKATRRKSRAVPGAAVAAVALFFWWNPASWIVTIGACGVGGVVGAAAGHVGHAWVDAERGKAFGKKVGVRECKISFPVMFPPFTIGYLTRCWKLYACVCPCNSLSIQFGTRSPN